MSENTRRKTLWLVNLPALLLVMALVLALGLGAPGGRMDWLIVHMLMLGLFVGLPLIPFSIWYIATHKMDGETKFVLICFNLLVLIPGAYIGLWLYLCATTSRMF